MNAKMKKIEVWLSTICLLFISFTSPAFAQDSIRWDFNNPNEITATNFENYEVKDGVFSGKTKWDPILGLSLPKEGVDAASLNFLTVRLYSSSAASTIEIVYSSPNKDWSLGRSFPVFPGWAVYTIDLNKLNWKYGDVPPEAQSWGGREKKISGFRLDPGNEADRTVKIDWMELSGPEGKEHKAVRETSPEEKVAISALRWSFTKDNNFLGWQPNFQSVEVKSGALKGTTQKSSSLLSPGFLVDASQYKTFVFEAKVKNLGPGDNVSCVYFQRAGETSLAAENYAAVYYTEKDDQVHTYRVDFSKNKNWQGIITQVRFDICYTPGVEFEIYECKFLR